MNLLTQQFGYEYIVDVYTNGTHYIWLDNKGYDIWAYLHGHLTLTRVPTFSYKL